MGKWGRKAEDRRPETIDQRPETGDRQELCTSHKAPMASCPVGAPHRGANEGHATGGADAEGGRWKVGDGRRTNDERPTPNVQRSTADGKIDEGADARLNVRAQPPDDRRSLFADRRNCVLVFTDANSMFERDALKKLVAPFQDGRIGGTCGRLVLHSPRDGGNAPPEPAYWDWEAKLKDAESAVDSCLGANGAIYAVRVDLFPLEIPDNTIIDDFVIGMKIREKCHRMRYVADAVAREEQPEHVADEWKRRVRIGAGDYQALGLCRRCLSPSKGLFAWMFWSHKVLRWFTPHLLLAALALTLALYAAVTIRLRVRSDGLGMVGHLSAVGGGKWVAAQFAAWLSLAGLAVLAGGAIAGGALRRVRSPLTKPLRLCHYFVLMQLALFVGFLRFCRGGLEGRWERTARR